MIYGVGGVIVVAIVTKAAIRYKWCDMFHKADHITTVKCVTLDEPTRQCLRCGKTTKL